ncbi:unnamed protein product [Vicia faba]|uniref:Uncharacterized protein n=1 Tax=Vicia faba TaxID=3906 RepID=A0AAV1B601_VICFA|nr:unnamed protein product [Vicia faba]
MDLRNELRGGHQNLPHCTMNLDDMTGVNSVDNKFLPCFVCYASSVDLDWSLLAFGGSYYYREGTVGAGEPYAVMDYDWKNFRHPKFPANFQLIQKKVQDPSSDLSKSNIMFHPLTGKCAQVKSNNELVLGDCKSHNQWSSEGNGSPIRLMDSATGLHLATTDGNGSLLCLEMDSDSSKIVTRKCICIDDYDSSCLDNPQSQWFQLISTKV